MKRAVTTSYFSSDIIKVWNIVTDSRRHAVWRSDLSKVEISGDGKTFIEYTKRGFPTIFNNTWEQFPERYVLNMQNRRMSGRWTGDFSRTEDGTRVEFSEEVTAKNPVMNLFAGYYLKKKQKVFIRDLKKALGE
ncbi:MAG: SRPBCC family protein [Oscillospiraceae bacterium]|nr:SRPBCC family protein [Oscillospiraceae bacterium]